MIEVGGVRGGSRGGVGVKCTGRHIQLFVLFFFYIWFKKFFFFLLYLQLVYLVFFFSISKLTSYIVKQFHYI